MGYFILILFILCLIVPLFSYVIFPWYLKFSVSSITKVKNNYQSITEWPAVTIVFSVFNEEKVIRRKLETILKSDYPKEKLHVLIGSDNSTDQTNQIIEEFISQNQNIILIKKESRNGKLKIIFSYIGCAVVKSPIGVTPMFNRRRFLSACI